MELLLIDFLSLIKTTKFPLGPSYLITLKTNSHKNFSINKKIRSQSVTILSFAFTIFIN